MSENEEQVRYIKTTISTATVGPPLWTFLSNPRGTGAALHQRGKLEDLAIPIILLLNCAVALPLIDKIPELSIDPQPFLLAWKYMQIYTKYCGVTLVILLLLATTLKKLQTANGDDSSWCSILKALLWGTIPVAAPLTVFLFFDFEISHTYSQETSSVVGTRYRFSVRNWHVYLAGILLLIGIIPSLVYTSKLLAGACKLKTSQAYCLLCGGVVSLSILLPVFLVIISSKDILRSLLLWYNF